MTVTFTNFTAYFPPANIIPPTLSLVGTNVSAGSTNITLPSGIQAGDLIVWTQHCANQTAGSVPTGFTLIVNTIVVAVNHNTAYKIADGTESGTTISGMTGSNYATTVAVFRLSTKVVSSVNLPTWNSEGSTSGAIVAQTITPPSTSNPLISFASASMRAAAANTNFSTESPAFVSKLQTIDASGDAIVTAFTMANVASSALTYTVDYDGAGTRADLHSGYLEVL